MPIAAIPNSLSISLIPSDALYYGFIGNLFLLKCITLLMHLCGISDMDTLSITMC